MASLTELRAEWSDDLASVAPRLEHRDVVDRDDLDRLLDELEERALAKQPFIVELVSSPTGLRLGIGLGAEGSVLTFKASDDPPYFVSVGHDSPPSDEDIGFYFQGHWSEFPNSALVAPKDARRAAHQLLLADERPGAVDWEEV